jgi:hypothetical protein
MSNGTHRNIKGSRHLASSGFPFFYSASIPTRASRPRRDAFDDALVGFAFPFHFRQAPRRSPLQPVRNCPFAEVPTPPRSPPRPISPARPAHLISADRFTGFFVPRNQNLRSLLRNFARNTCSYAECSESYFCTDHAQFLPMQVFGCAYCASSFRVQGMLARSPSMRAAISRQPAAAYAGFDRSAFYPGALHPSEIARMTCSCWNCSELIFCTDYDQLF